MCIRDSLYIVSSVDATGDPRVTLVTIVFVVGCLILLKAVLERKIYKKQRLDVMEIAMYFNIVSFAAFTWYTFDTRKTQAAVAHISVVVTFVLLLSVIIYHICRFTSLFSMIRKTKISMTKLLVYKRKKSIGQVVKTPDNQTPITYSTVEISMCLKELEKIHPQSAPNPLPDNAPLCTQSESAKPGSEMESTIINCPSDPSPVAAATQNFTNSCEEDNSNSG